MIIQYTKALRTKLKIPDIPADDTPCGPHLRWYAHFFRANRVQYVLTTNAASLYSVVVFAAGLKDEGDYLERFLPELGKHLESDELELIYKRCIHPYTGSVLPSKPTDRSVLGSMNNMVQLCKWELEFRDPTPWDMSKRLNKTPFQAIEFKFPKEQFAKLPPCPASD